MDSNVENMAMRMKYGFYEFLVMLFKLCNVSSTFIIFINLIFHDKLHEFIIIYVYDILIFFCWQKNILNTWSMSCKKFKIISFMLIKWKVNLQS
jgi:hypothetical protein